MEIICIQSEINVWKMITAINVLNPIMRCVLNMLMPFYRLNKNSPFEKKYYLNMDHLIMRHFILPVLRDQYILLGILHVFVDLYKPLKIHKLELYCTIMIKITN